MLCESAMEEEKEDNKNKAFCTLALLKSIWRRML